MSRRICGFSLDPRALKADTHRKGICVEVFKSAKNKETWRNLWLRIQNGRLLLANFFGNFHTYFNQ